jgi:hypothetical protein
MKLGEGTVIFATEEAKKEWEGKKLPVKQKKSSCPACEIKLEEKDYNEEEIINENNGK